MKIKDTFVMRNLAGSNVVVPIGSDMVDFNGMITLNETGAFLWEELKTHKTKNELVEALLAEYSGVTAEDVTPDVEEFLNTLDSKGIIEHE